MAKPTADELRAQVKSLVWGKLTKEQKHQWVATEDTVGKVRDYVENPDFRLLAVGAALFKNMDVIASANVLLTTINENLALDTPDLDTLLGEALTLLNLTISALGRQNAIKSIMEGETPALEDALWQEFKEWKASEGI